MQEPAAGDEGRRNRRRPTPRPPGTNGRGRTDPESVPGPIAALSTALQRLHGLLTATRFALPLQAASDAERHRDNLLRQVDDYLLPRLARLGAPMLVVVGGSTGAGKSTLINSLLRAPVSPAGALRPTTRSPVLVCNPEDARSFDEPHLLPHLPRVDGGTGAPRLHVVSAPVLPPGVAFLDAPDIDSLVTTNRQLADELLGAADFWLFLTTATRYADAVPWEVLREAEERGVAVALVLSRVPDEGRDAVVDHLWQLLVEQEFDHAPLFVMSEQRLDDEGLLSEDAVTPIREWFGTMAHDADRRNGVVRQTLGGVLASIHSRVERVAAQLDAQHSAVVALRDVAGSGYDEAMVRIEEGIRDGALLRGEVLARWQEAVRSGELRHTLEARTGKLHDQVRAAVTGRALAGRGFTAALGSAIAALVAAAAADASEQVAAQWKNQPAGRFLLDRAEDDPELRQTLRRPLVELEGRARDAVSAWQQAVLNMIREDAAAKRPPVRLGSFSANALQLLMMVGIFVSDAAGPSRHPRSPGDTPGDAARALLRELHADEDVRRLAPRARQDLLDRVRELLDSEQRRYTELLREAVVDPAASDRLRGAAGTVEHHRTAAGLTTTETALAAFPLPAGWTEAPPDVPGEADDDLEPDPEPGDTFDQPAEDEDARNAGEPSGAHTGAGTGSDAEITPEAAAGTAGSSSDDQIDRPERGSSGVGPKDRTVAKSTKTSRRRR